MEFLKLWVTSSLIGVKNPFRFVPFVVTWHVSTSCVHGRVHACAWCCRHNVPYLDYEQLVLNSNKEGMDFLRKGQYKQGPVCHVCHLTQGLTESWQVNEKTVCFFLAYPNEVKESRNQKVNLRVNGGGDFLFDICDRFALRRKDSTFANFVFCHAFDQWHEWCLWSYYAPTALVNLRP